ncbi:MAG: ATP-dependent RecD-like DNA helicase [bacterium]
MEQLLNVKIVDSIVSKDDFSIAKGKYIDSSNLERIVTLIGSLSMIKGEMFNLDGYWEMHKTYGQQFQIKNYERLNDMSLEDIKEYLMTFKGVGKKRANIIVDTFGMKTLDVLKNYPYSLSEAGIPNELIKSISTELHRKEAMHDLIKMLRPYQISLKSITKIYDSYGKDSKEIIKKNPYRLYHDIKGISYEMADTIGRDLGATYDAGIRLQAVIKSILWDAANSGHCFLTVKQLIKFIDRKITSKNQKPINRNYIINNLMYMEEYNEVIIESDLAVYLPTFYYAENYVARKIKKLREADSKVTIKKPIETILKEVKIKTGINYANEQAEAVRKALTENILILTGGPGTGKTTTVNGIIEGILINNPETKIGLAAPTGRAAKRMEEATNKKASTIHRMLEYKPFNDGIECKRNDENPLDYDVLICDEFSMVDIQLLELLLRALARGTRLIIVGDVDQLPSVGAGKVLTDLIDSNVISTIRLKAIFRQADTSMIVVNANAMNAGEFPEYNEKDFIFTKCLDEKKVIKTVVDKYTGMLSKEEKTTDDIQVLVPMRKAKGKTLIVSEIFNNEIQKVINPRDDKKPEVIYGKYIYRLGDKVMQTKNNYDKDCFNGDIGYITDIKMGQDPTVVVNFENNKSVEFVGREEILELVLAYAMTIHKSQGSECPNVIMPFVMGHKFMLARNLIYTGVTRAKKTVDFVGDDKAIKQAIINKSNFDRNTKLKQRVI